jgi:hypothetical protein
MKILFILKERFYNQTNVKSYGLINSSKMVVDYIQKLNFECKVVTVVDANGIDKEVFLYKPDVVVIEALWVPADKLKELIEIRRYKHIKWIVRIHSDAGFLSAETFAMKHINDYIALNKNNLAIAPNCEEFTEYLANALKYDFVYLPNIVCINDKKNNETEKDNNIINIGCFGALRILKNQLFQAMCAIKAADTLRKTLHFHVTVNIKDDSDLPNPILKNLEELFKNSKHKLIKHQWQENDEFQELIKKMDIGMQVSFTESFNIVAADFINNDRVIIVSDAITWMPEILKVSTTDYDEVTKKIIFAYTHKNSCILKRKMRRNLMKYNIKSKYIWFNYLKNLF